MVRGFLFFVSVFSLCLCVTLAGPGFAAQKTGPKAQVAAGTPSVPKPLAEQQARGAQVFYMGKYESLDGWVLIRGTQPEFYYATSDGKALVMGFLFNGDGQLLTGQQLKTLSETQKDGIAGILASGLAGVPEAGPDAAEAPAAAPGKVTAAQRLLQEMQAAPGMTYGQDGKPVFYAFIDPNCAHCQAFLKSAEPYVAAGDFAVRMIPVGFDDKSKKQAAFALAAADGAARMVAYAKGDADVLPVMADFDTAAIDANLAIMRSWHLTGTPIIVYTAAKSGEIKLVRGRPLDMPGAVADLTGKK